MASIALVSGFAADVVHALPLSADGKLGEPIRWTFSANPNPTYLTSCIFAGGVTNVYTASRTIDGGASLVASLRVSPSADSPLGFAAAEVGSPQDGHGTNSCFVIASPSGRHVILTNWASGSVSVFPRNAADGSLSAASSVLRPGKNTHHLTWDSRGRAIIPCMGNDQILVCELNEDAGELTVLKTFDCPLGSGPRHVLLNDTRTLAYVVNELNATVTSWLYNEDSGALTSPEVLSTLREGQTAADTGTKSAAIMLTRDGRYLYVTNRSERVPSSVAGFMVSGATGRLSALGLYDTDISTPRAACVDATGSFVLVANQTSDTITVLRVDGATGALSLADSRVLPGSKPTCVQMLKQ